MLSLNQEVCDEIIMKEDYQSDLSSSLLGAADTDTFHCLYGGSAPGHGQRGQQRASRCSVDSRRGARKMISAMLDFTLTSEFL